MVKEDETEPLIGSDVSQSKSTPKESEIRTYHRRWYLLLLFCLVSHAGGLTWNTWGPIAQSAKLVFHWSDGIVALATAWGQITSLLGMFGAAYIMDVKGKTTEAGTMLKHIIIKNKGCIKFYSI